MFYKMKEKETVILINYPPPQVRCRYCGSRDKVKMRLETRCRNCGYKLNNKGEIKYGRR